MKTFGLVLIIIGIAMILVKGFSVTTEKKVVDLGPIEINKKENKWIGWPTYAGVVIAVAGTLLVFTNQKKPR
jgi:drug/metabolite transporter (DMT)-like permease